MNGKQCVGGDVDDDPNLLSIHTTSHVGCTEVPVSGSLTGWRPASGSCCLNKLVTFGVAPGFPRCVSEDFNRWFREP